MGCIPGLWLYHSKLFAFIWISSHINVNKWSCNASHDMNSTILLFYCENFMQGGNKNDWNKGACILLRMSGGDGEELGNWNSGGPS